MGRHAAPPSAVHLSSSQLATFADLPVREAARTLGVW
jgi:hypothetical protein